MITIQQNYKLYPYLTNSNENKSSLSLILGTRLRLCIIRLKARARCMRVRLAFSTTFSLNNKFCGQICDKFDHRIRKIPWAKHGSTITRDREKLGMKGVQARCCMLNILVSLFVLLNLRPFSKFYFLFRLAVFEKRLFCFSIEQTVNIKHYGL